MRQQTFLRNTWSNVDRFIIFFNVHLAVVCKYFNSLIVIFSSYIPEGFRYNYIVPTHEPKECYSKSLTCDDFRGIPISPIISKVFEYCFLDRFGSFFERADNQFGFEKGIGCSFAIRVVRNDVEKFTKGGSTSNLCAIDLSKAFDRVNHHALYQKLMKRVIPNELLNILECWLSRCYSCVKWYDAWSYLFIVNFGIRQGLVLSPFLFAVYCTWTMSLDLLF